MIKPRLFLAYNNKNVFSSFGKSVEKANRGELGNIIELRTCYTCNNNCRHCPVAHKKHLNDRTFEECKKILKDNRQDRNLLIISGGEPTIRDDIFDLISYARDIDYQWIQLKTNGRIFYYKDFTEKMVKLIKEHPVSDEQRDINHENGYNFRGLDIFEFYISIYGSNPEMHDFISGVPKSFEQTIQGIKNLLCLNQVVTVNIVITKINYRYLLEIVKYLDDIGVKYIELSFINIDGDAFTNFENIVPRINDVQPYIFDVIKNLHSISRENIILINNIPRCCIQEVHFPHLSESYYPYDGHKMYKFVELDSTTTYYEEEVKNNIKGKKCKCCINDPICFGLNKKYVEKLGFDELNPVLGNLKNLVEENKIELFENLDNLKFSDLKLEFDDPKLKVNFNDIKADVISLFSGGVDSTLATATYAKNNEDKKIVLITFDDSHSPGAEGAFNNAKLLMKKHKNIIWHFIVSIPYLLTKKLIYEELEEDYKKFNLYPTCDKCKLLRLTYCIYLLKKYFKGNIIISGHKRREGSPLALKRDVDFLNEYGIKFIRPLELISDKTYVIESAARKEFIHFPPQSTCTLSSLKSRLLTQSEKIAFSKNSSFHENMKNRYSKLLEYNGILKNMLIS